ncbi:unnamed protein product [marine sediment metagenome]|uniref:SAP domain-containing protein n=1 Tax=marine sediment metagenome TaxID=412755 RepID=X1JZ47_9ZZZZ
MEVRLIKWQYGYPLNVTPYELGREIGMALDTVPNALEELKLVYSNRKLTITPWLVRENTHDLYWTDSGGNFIAEFSKQDIQEVERGILEWLREWRESIVLGKLGKQVWPTTESNPGAVPVVRLTEEEFVEEKLALRRKQAEKVGVPFDEKRERALLRGEYRIIAPPAMSVVDYDRKYSLSELREKAKQAGLSASGSKKEIATRLIAKGVV